MTTKRRLFLKSNCTRIGLRLFRGKFRHNRRSFYRYCQPQTSPKPTCLWVWVEIKLSINWTLWIKYKALDSSLVDLKGPHQPEYPLSRWYRPSQLKREVWCEPRPLKRDSKFWNHKLKCPKKPSKTILCRLLRKMQIREQWRLEPQKIENAPQAAKVELVWNLKDNIQERKAIEVRKSCIWSWVSHSQSPYEKESKVQRVRIRSATQLIRLERLLVKPQ